MTTFEEGDRAQISTPFGQVPLFVLLVKELSTGTLWLYAYLCCRASRKTGRCRVSMQRAARDRGADIRTVQTWRALLEREGLIVTLQETGRSSKFLVIRHPKFCDWASQQNFLNLESKRQQFRHFGRKGALAKASAAQANPASPSGDAKLPLTGANPASAITELEHNSVSNIEADGGLNHRATGEKCLASQVVTEKETNCTDSQNGSWIYQKNLNPPARFRGFDIAVWNEWLVSDNSGSSRIQWLMGQADRISSELGVNNMEAQWILENCLLQAKAEGSSSRLQEIISETIEKLTQQ